MTRGGLDSLRKMQPGDACFSLHTGADPDAHVMSPWSLLPSKLILQWKFSKNLQDPRLTASPRRLEVTKGVKGWLGILDRDETPRGGERGGAECKSTAALH